MKMKIYDKIHNAKIKRNTRTICIEALETALSYLTERESLDTFGMWVKDLDSEDTDIRVPTENAIEIILNFMSEL